MHIDEPVEVDLSAGGVPLSFRWRGVTYVVVSTPEPWLGRRAWWRVETRVTRGHAAPLDVPMWRVDAVPLGASPDVVDGTYDLALGVEGWWLATAHSAELDELLFA